MTLQAALQNLLFLSAPAVVYAIVVSLRFRFSPREVAERLGLILGGGRYYVIALLSAIPASAVAIAAASQTSGFKGSMIAPFVGVAPTTPIVAAILIYGFVSTGLPEELLFRGLVGGALFRRLSFRKANAIQAFIFLAPHLLILLIAPHLWYLAIVLPLALGILLGWLRHRSGSIGPAVLVHAVSNAAGALSVLNWSIVR